MQETREQEQETGALGEHQDHLDLPSVPEEEVTEPLVEELVVREGSKSRRVGGEEVEEENNDKAVFDVASVEECIERVIELNTQKLELRKKEQEEAKMLKTLQKRLKSDEARRKEQEEAKMLKTSRKRLKSDERPDLVQCGYCHYSTRISVGLHQTAMSSAPDRLVLMTLLSYTRLMTSQTDARLISSLSGTRLMTSQSDTRLMTSQSDTQLMTSQSDTRLITSQSDTRLITSQSDTRLMTSQSDTRLMTSQSDTQLMTSQSDTRLMTSQTDTRLIPSLSGSRLVNTAWHSSYRGEYKAWQTLS